MDITAIEAAIQQNATSAVIGRGEDYYETGAVSSLVRRGSTLFAEVEGSGYEAYQVRVALDGETIVDADCSCPYGEEWGGWCKHIVATLLAYADAAEEIAEEPTLSARLEPLKREQLVELMNYLAERLPAVHDIASAWLELHGATPEEAHGTGGRESAPLDPQPFRRRVRAALRSLDHMRASEAYWHVGGVVDEVRGLLDEARRLTETGDAENALRVLEAITEEYVKGFHELDDSDGEVGGFFDELGEAWTEALLTADLPANERAPWQKRLEKWQRKVGDYSGGDSFEAALAAARDGWEPVERHENAWYADELVTAKLNVLERQECFEEALLLAEVAGQDARRAILLARLGRAAEAADVLRSGFLDGEESLAVACALEENGRVEAALEAVAAALPHIGSPPGYRPAPLAEWLRDTANAHGARELALLGAREVVLAAPTLHDYRRAQELAGEGWPALRDDLLEKLRRWQDYEKTGAVDILLHEQETGAALRLAQDSHDYRLLERAADAALDDHPREVARIGRKQAEEIMDAGKSGYYAAAVQWLRRVKSAQRKLEETAQWREYLEQQIQKHAKKWKLRPMLEALRS